MIEGLGNTERTEDFVVAMMVQLIHLLHRMYSVTADSVNSDIIAVISRCGLGASWINISTRKAVPSLASLMDRT